MTHARASAEAYQRWGKKAVVRKYKQPSSEAQRTTARADLITARADNDRIDAEIKAWLAAQPEYQALVQRKKAARDRIEAVRGYVHYHQYSVGKDIWYAVVIEGNGDTWEEAFAENDRKEHAR